MILITRQCSTKAINGRNAILMAGGKFFRQVIPKPDSLKMISKNYCRYGITPEIFREELKNHQDTDIV